MGAGARGTARVEASGRRGLLCDHRRAARLGALGDLRDVRADSPGQVVEPRRGGTRGAVPLQPAGPGGRPEAIAVTSEISGGGAHSGAGGAPAPAAPAPPTGTGDGYSQSPTGGGGAAGPPPGVVPIP